MDYVSVNLDEGVGLGKHEGVLVARFLEGESGSSIVDWHLVHLTFHDVV